MGVFTKSRFGMVVDITKMAQVQLNGATRTKLGSMNLKNVIIVNVLQKLIIIFVNFQIIIALITANSVLFSAKKNMNYIVKGGISVPTAIFSEDGRAGIKDAYENFGGNMVKSIKGAWDITPMGVSRMVDARNGEENGMPSLVPSLGREESETGKDFKKEEDGLYYEKTSGGGRKLIGDGKSSPSGIINSYDSNPLFKLLWHVVPGFASFTKYHDYSVDSGAIKDQYKEISIPPYYAINSYGAMGTPVNMTVDTIKLFFAKQDAQTNSPNTSSK